MIEEHQDTNIKIVNNLMQLTILSRNGNYNHLFYIKRKHLIKQLVARSNQKNILGKIKDHYKKNLCTTVFIHGSPNSGKSSIGLLLAMELKASFCNSFNPTEPGDQLSMLYNRADPSEKNPFIVVIDEADVMLEKIHSCSIAPHKNIPILIRDKPGWNLFFDNINLGIYPYMILIMTSNKPDTYINEMDSCYLRSGRVDLTFKM
jgi:hypothetical protein